MKICRAARIDFVVMDSSHLDIFGVVMYTTALDFEELSVSTIHVFSHTPFIRVHLLVTQKGGTSTSTPMGIMFILLSLFMDGVTAGVQKRLKADLGKVGVKPKPYDFMFWTNLYMMCVALLIAVILGEVSSGMAYCSANPEIFSL